MEIPKEIFNSIEGDPDIRKKTKELVEDALDRTKHLLETASPDVQERLLRTLLPAAARSMSVKQVDDQLNQLKEAMQTMMDKISGIEEE